MNIKLIKYSKRKGQALVEFALVLPIFLMVVFSIFEFGRYFFCIHNLKYAANEGGKVAVYRFSPDKIIEKVQEAGKAFNIPTSGIVIEYSDNSGKTLVVNEDYSIFNGNEVLFTNPESDAFCKITVNYDFEPVAPYPLITNDKGVIAITVSNFIKLQL